MGEYIKALQGAILHLHRCKATHVETVPITETFQGRTVGDGEVEVFTLKGHPKAKRAYAWAHREGEGDKHTRYIAVLSG